MISINVLIAELYRTLKSEVEELKELDQEREKYYELKCSEMNEFMQNVERFRSEKRLQVENLRDQVKEVYKYMYEHLSMRSVLDLTKTL